MIVLGSVESITNMALFLRGYWLEDEYDDDDDDDVDDVDGKRREAMEVGLWSDVFIPGRTIIRTFFGGGNDSIAAATAAVGKLRMEDSERSDVMVFGMLSPHGFSFSLLLLFLLLLLLLLLVVVS